MNVNALVEKILKLERAPCIKIVVKELDTKVFFPIENLKAYIVDLEGDFLWGLMIFNKTIHFYVEKCEDSPDKNQLHFHILNIFELLDKENFIGFTFSNYEILRIKKSISLLKLKKAPIDPELEVFLDNFSLIDLQKKKFESLVGKVYETLDIFYPRSATLTTRDPLFRNIKIIPNMARMKLFDTIIDHNVTCLANEALLLKIFNIINQI